MNTITGRMKQGNVLIITGRYKMDIPLNGFPNDLDYMRTTDIYLDAKFKNKPTVVASVHHVDTTASPTKGTTVPYAVATIDVDINWGATQTRIMISAVELHARRISYEYWCEYIVMGEVQ